MCNEKQVQNYFAITSLLIRYSRVWRFWPMESESVRSSFFVHQLKRCCPASTPASYLCTFQPLYRPILYTSKRPRRESDSAVVMRHSLEYKSRHGNSRRYSTYPSALYSSHTQAFKCAPFTIGSGHIVL